MKEKESKKNLILVCAEILGVVVLVLLLLWNPLKKNSSQTYPEGEHKLPTVLDDGTVVDGSTVIAVTSLTPSPIPTEPAVITDTVETGDVTDGPDTDPDASTVTDEPTSTDATSTDSPEETSGLTEKEQEILASLDEEMRAKYEAFSKLEIPENLAFADVEESLSVRVSGKWDAEQIGIMKPMDSCTVLSVEGEWAKIKTGSITGYCRYKYLITGDRAKELAKKYVIRKATTTANVNIRSAATTTESNTLKAVEKGHTYTVTNPIVFSEDPDAPLWVEISFDNKSAYLAAGKVDITCSFPVGSAYNGG